MSRFHRFVALGDSFTEGLHDDLGSDGRHLGWADRVAAALARQGAIRYANLAVRGRLLGEVVDAQVPQAQELDADLVSFHAGGNDVLRPSADLDRLAGIYDQGVAQLRDHGAEVLLFTVLESTGRSGPLARRLAGRIAAFNDQVVRPTAARHGAHLVDIGDLPALHDRRLWHEDRLHLAPAGHRRVAAAVLETLGVDHGPHGCGPTAAGPPGWWRTPLHPAPPAGPLALVGGEVRWARRHLLPWVGRRLRGVSSGDTLGAKRPELR